VLNDEPAFVSRGSIGLRNLTVTQETYVRAAEEIVIRDSSFDDELFVRFTDPAATFVVGDSSFTTLNVAGRRGENTYEDLGGNLFGELILKRFDVEADEDEDEED
jgi:hypothetical protein